MSRGSTNEPAAARGLWSSGLLMELQPEECLDLIGSVEVGRMVFNDSQGPVALPVNHVVSGATVLFRTTPCGPLAQHLRDGGVCAFEADAVDTFTRSGWSVLLRGTTSLMWHPDESTGVILPAPWPEGTRSLLVRLVPSEITGRRVLPS